MVKLKILKKNDYDYTLENNNKKYNLNIEFYNIEVNIGDYIYLSEKLLKDENLFSFGPIKQEDNIKEEDIIKLIKDNKEYYLQRYYG